MLGHHLTHDKSGNWSEGYQFSNSHKYVKLWWAIRILVTIDCVASQRITVELEDDCVRLPIEMEIVDDE